MSIRKRRWLLVLIVVALLAAGLTVAAGAVLAEGAVHPLLTRRPSDTAATAYSIAQASGATAQKVSIMTPDGVKLNAWWLTPAHSDGRGVMVCHGVADSAFGALGYALLFLHHGYSVLVPESRGHGESGGFVSYGVQESGDIVQWLKWMKDNGTISAYGFGESLGGAILIQSLARGAPFRAIVAECPYSSFEAVADERVARVIASSFARLLVREGVIYVHLRYGVDLANSRPDQAIEQVHVPILLIHGLADNETSPGNSIRLAKLNPEWVKLWLVPGAKHTGAYAQDPKAFEEAVLNQFEGPPPLR